LLERLGVTNFDCRLKNEKLSSKDRASYLFNTTIAGIESADACLLIGANPRKDAPILNARIRKRFLTKKLEIASIGCDADLTYDVKNLGAEIQALKDILDGKSDFSKTLQKAEKPMLILGHDVLSGKDGDLILNYAKKIAEKFNLIQDEWNGFNFLSKSSGLLNGLELGFVGDTNITEISEKIEKSEIKMLILHSVDDDIDFTSIKNSFIVYIGSHGDRGAHIADVILSATAYSEKNAIYVNLEGRPQSTSLAAFAPGEARTDWEIIAELAKKLEIDLGFKTQLELRTAIEKTNPIFANLDEVTKASWIKSNDLTSEPYEEKLLINDTDFYLTNPITRASRTLNKCSSELA